MLCARGSLEGGSVDVVFTRRRDVTFEEIHSETGHPRASGFTIDAEATRRSCRTEHGFELGKDRKETCERLRGMFERGEVTILHEPSPASSYARVKVGRGKTVDVELVSTPRGWWEIDAVQALSFINEGLLETLEVLKKTKREREAVEGDAREEQPRSSSATPRASPAKGTSIGNWVLEGTRTRPKLAKLVEEKGAK